jgi:hypothetical protein
MKAIGGYFELETNRGVEYHNDCIRLNSGRNCLEYIIRTREYSKIYLPYYFCDVLLEPMQKLNIEYSFYHIDSNFNPIIDFSVSSGEALFYINFFGIKDDVVQKLAQNYSNLIIDNSQAFFAKRIHGVDTFYSPRKFFGVPDGGYLYADHVELNIEAQDVSLNRMNHLLKRIESGPEAGFEDYKINDASIMNQPIKNMSAITKAILKSIDYSVVRTKRQNNYHYLNNKLLCYNKLGFDILNDVTPMAYPLLSNQEGVREYLIKRKIYVAKYWPNVSMSMKTSTIEYKLADNIIPLPIDQRYNMDDMQIIVNIINEFYAK